MKKIIIPIIVTILLVSSVFVYADVKSEYGSREVAGPNIRVQNEYLPQTQQFFSTLGLIDVLKLGFNIVKLPDGTQLLCADQASESNANNYFVPSISKPGIKMISVDANGNQHGAIVWQMWEVSNWKRIHPLNTQPGINGFIVFQGEEKVRGLVEYYGKEIYWQNFYCDVNNVCADCSDWKIDECFISNDGTPNMRFKRTCPNDACTLDRFVTEPYWDEQICQREPDCFPDWNSGPWGECINGIRSRTVTDDNKCGILNNKPSETTSCLEEGEAPSLDFEIFPVIGQDVIGPGQQCQYQFTITNLNPEEKTTTNIEMFWIAKSNPLADELVKSVGGLNQIQALFGFAGITLEPSCQVLEEFNQRAIINFNEISKANRDQPTFLVNPKTPTEDSVLSDGSSNWDQDGEYYLVVQTFDECGTGATGIALKNVNIVSEKTSCEINIDQTVPVSEPSGENLSGGRLIGSVDSCSKCGESGTFDICSEKECAALGVKCFFTNTIGFGGKCSYQESTIKNTPEGKVKCVGEICVPIGPDPNPVPSVSGQCETPRDTEISLSDFVELLKGKTCGVSRTKKEFKDLQKFSEAQKEDLIRDSVCFVDGNCIPRDFEGTIVKGTCTNPSLVGVDIKSGLLGLTDIFLRGASEAGVCVAKDPEASTLNFEFLEDVSPITIGAIVFVIVALLAFTASGRRS